MVKKQENIILVNPSDRKIGVIEKMLAHQFGMLHRAFSVFIFRDTSKGMELLLQKRNQNKYHAGGLWTNTCCSHPHTNETIRQSAQKRLHYEMGINVQLKIAGKFHYIATFDNGMTENEIDHVLIGYYDSNDIPYNKTEVEDYKWLNISALLKALEKKPLEFTPWIKPALVIALNAIHAKGLML